MAQKKHLDSSVGFAQFYRQCFERWKITSAREKPKRDHTAQSDAAHSNRDVVSYAPPKDDKEGRKIPMILKDHHLPSSSFALNADQ
ncbi:High mobility group protein B2 [Lemmus lemmus]